MKSSSKQSRIGRAGVALIDIRVGEMGHHWHPGAGDLDTGIDGEIELVDPATAEVRNFRIGVQSKATEGVWRQETDDGLLYKARPKDIDYWMSSNQPVLLVVSRPRTNEAYFRNVQQWCSDPKVRATGLVDFNKQTDRFDASAASRLFASEARVEIVLEPPLVHCRVRRRSKSNLLPIYWRTESIWSVVSPAEKWGDWFQKALAAEQARTDLAMRDGRLWSLTDFSDAFLEAIEVDDAPEIIPLADYAESDLRDHQNLIFELVRKTIVSAQHRQLRWSAAARVAYFRLVEDKPERTYKWSKGRGRTVVKPRESQKHEGLSGYRHEAAELGGAPARRPACPVGLPDVPVHVRRTADVQLSRRRAEEDEEHGSRRRGQPAVAHVGAPAG